MVGRSALQEPGSRRCLEGTVRFVSGITNPSLIWLQPSGCLCIAVVQAARQRLRGAQLRTLVTCHHRLRSGLAISPGGDDSTPPIHGLVTLLSLPMNLESRGTAGRYRPVSRISAVSV